MRLGVKGWMQFLLFIEWRLQPHIRVWNIYNMIGFESFKNWLNPVSKGITGFCPNIFLKWVSLSKILFDLVNHIHKNIKKKKITCTVFSLVFLKKSKCNSYNLTKFSSQPKSKHSIKIFSNVKKSWKARYYVSFKFSCIK